MSKTTGPKTVMSGFSSTENIEEKIESMIAEDGFVSKSEVIRQAVRALFKQLHPYYKEIREKSESEKERIAKMSEEEYLAEMFAGIGYETVQENSETMISFKHKDPNIPVTWKVPFKQIKTVVPEDAPFPIR